MVPKPTSDELWGQATMPSPCGFDILMPNGTVLKDVKFNRDETLENVKIQVWKMAKNEILFRQLSESSSYVFVGLNRDSKMEEFYDESRRLCDLRLFIPVLKLVEPQGNTDEKILQSQISLAIGRSIHEFDSSKDFEFIDARRSFLSLCMSVVKDRENQTPDEQLLYYFPPELDPHHGSSSSSTLTSPSASPTSPENHPSDHMFKIFLSENQTYLDGFEVSLNLSLKPKEAVDYLRSINTFLQKDDFILKVCGFEEYLLGDYHLRNFKYVSRCISQQKKCELIVRKKSDMMNLIPDEPFRMPAFLRRSSESGRMAHSQLCQDIEMKRVIPLWNMTEMFKVYVNVATYANVKDFDRIFVTLGVYHGMQPLCPLRQTEKVAPTYPKWQENIEFDLHLEDIPRGARLCVSMCSIAKSSAKDGKKSSTTTVQPVPIAYGNIALFDCRERLLSGKVLLSLWRVPKDHDALLYPLGVTGPNPEKDALSLDIEFPKFSSPVVFPPDELITIYANHLLDLASKNRTTGHSNVLESRRSSVGTDEEKKRISEIVRMDPLTDLSSGDKDLMWRLRNHCMSTVPDSLPRLLDSLKWSSREEVAEMYILLKKWQPIGIHHALELLDCKFTDPKVRSHAVQSLDRGLPDHLLIEYLLQLVHVILHEPYLDNDISRFLLKRSLLNRNVGHYFFWLLKAEIHDPINSKPCSLILEAYLRGIGTLFLKSTIKQVEAQDKLTLLSNILKEKENSTSKERISFLRETLNQMDFKDALQFLRSPLRPSVSLGQIQVDDCKIMDSAKRPLWLVWQNGDFTSRFITTTKKQIDLTHAIIFKNGDDLRQDMLTLQVLRIMDSIWRSEGLDLKMLPYTCIATGKQVGLIEVVRESKTIMSLQRSLGLRAAYQLGSKELHKWFESTFKSKDDDTKYLKYLDNFTKSCAGYCVATFILGIGDRNPDNIMINDEGQIFHIDFGHFLGHFKKKFGINRERVPFVLTDDFLFVISRGEEPSDSNIHYQEFNKLCEKAYLILRKHSNLLIALFTLMLSTGIPELQSPDDIGYLRTTLQVDKTDDSEAVSYFRNQLMEAKTGSTYTKIDWFFHNVRR